MSEIKNHSPISNCFLNIFNVLKKKIVGIFQVTAIISKGGKIKHMIYFLVEAEVTQNTKMYACYKKRRKKFIN